MLSSGGGRMCHPAEDLSSYCNQKLEAILRELLPILVANLDFSAIFLYETTFRIILNRFKPTYKIRFFDFLGVAATPPEAGGGIVPKIVVGGVEMFQV